jgi:hypothetical protein
VAVYRTSTTLKHISGSFCEHEKIKQMVSYFNFVRAGCGVMVLKKM